ncbi:MAG: hemerythrin family protein [Magnetococcales bacterium]|nr:hemerythrin family protein [Magnetococcales bacterium]
MESFHWDSYFNTGLIMVDEQHKHLVNILNYFGELVQRPEGASEEDIESVFAALAAYAVYHFREEENLMVCAQIDSRHQLSHAAEHADFLQEVTRMRADSVGDPREAALFLLKFLTQWLVYHILGSDQMMAMQIDAMSSGATAEEAYLTAQKSRDPATSALLQAIHGLFHQLAERNRILFAMNRQLYTLVDQRSQELSEAYQRLEEMPMSEPPHLSPDATPWYAVQEE